MMKSSRATSTLKDPVSLGGDADPAGTTPRAIDQERELSETDVWAELERALRKRQAELEAQRAAQRKGRR